MTPELTIAQRPALTTAEKQRKDVVRISEIFHSIQGESSWAGRPCTFVRLTGCGLRCTYCDTEYAFYEGDDRSVAEVVEEALSYGSPLVELTGGEPLEQEAVYPLINAFLERGIEVMLETGGHMDISRVDARVRRIVDLKTPSSGMMKRNLLSNISELTQNDEVKFVIGSRADYDWAVAMVREHALTERVPTVLFSPVAGALAPNELARWILEDRLPKAVRFQIQMHKVIWPATLRGV